MMRFLNALRGYFSPKSGSLQTPEQWRQDFRLRYTHFRSLLTANNNALQAMAELEKIYYGRESYRMADVRPKITTIMVNVYKMITNLMAMSRGRYKELEKSFNKISSAIECLVDETPVSLSGPHLLELSAVRRRDRAEAGDKMANLGEISQVKGIRIPPGFVITASATRAFLNPALLVEINRLLQILNPDDVTHLTKTCGEIQDLIRRTPVPEELERDLYHHYHLLEQEAGIGCRVALRSSAIGEDVAGISFAGLYRTLLNKDKSTLTEAYREVIASKYGAKAIAYRRQRGYRHQDIEMCVGCLVMIDSLVSGVMYSRDHEDGDTIRIHSTRGYGSGVVDGTRTTDLHIVSREKPHQLILSENNHYPESETRTAGEAASLLSFSQIRKLAETALLLESHFGAPQDVEWSYDGSGELYILQSRPILQKSRDPGVTEAVPVQVQATPEPPIYIGGINVSQGVGCGQLCIIRSPEEMVEFKENSVLIVEYPLPEYAPLLGRAVAVIAEHGSEAGHLATVAREFGLPALFGVKGAMLRFQTHEALTVNATARAVYSGMRKDLLKGQAVKKDPMAGSPIQKILTEVLQHITPLNLNDPNSSQFKPSWCETLHDITRFCHERSISEMFSFSSGSMFDKSAAKRLVGDVPLEWWIINLADGFSDQVSDDARTVRIDDVTSLPMLAVWKGITAFPWQGPPPVSARGFGAIIFQSTMRPDLDPAVASPLAARNYFLIARNFCNLSVRLGYHYAMIESYMSELLTENYITFRFKGGAADMQRKAVRARLLADILERFDFRIELRSDALLARIKKRDIPFLEQRLKILGYLTLHARQLDMVMNQPVMVERYRQKFINDIEVMLNSSGESPEGENNESRKLQDSAG